MRRRKPSRAVQRHKKALKLAERLVSENLFELYNALCSQPFRRRCVTAYRILCGRKIGGK